MAVTANVSFLNPVSRSLDNFSIDDIFYRVMSSNGEQRTNRTITIVDISDLYDRAKYGELIDSLESYGASVIALDVMFEGMRGDTVGSMKLLQSVLEAPENVVYGNFLHEWSDDAQRYTRRTGAFFMDMMPDSAMAHTNIPADRFGHSVNTVHTRFEFEGKNMNSLSYETARRYSSEVKRDIDDEMRIDFVPTNFAVIPFSKIDENQDKIADRIVLVGPYADIEDQVYTPIGRISGVEYHAYAIQTILDMKDLHETGPLLTLIISALMIWLTSVLYNSYRSFYSHYSHWLIVYFLNTSLLVSWMLLLWSSLLVYIAFIAYMKFDVTINMTQMMMGVLLIVMNSNFYSACITVLYNRCGWKWLRRSMYLQRNNVSKRNKLELNDNIDEIKSINLNIKR